jgi:hypothetical protein
VPFYFLKGINPFRAKFCAQAFLRKFDDKNL